MADQRPGSFAREIDPDGGIKGPDLRGAFDQAKDAPATPAPEQSTPPIASQQVANSNLAPREPAPSFGYDRTKAGQHIEAMRKDDRAVKEPSLQAKAQLIAKQNAARKAKGLPSLGKSFDRDRERGDD